MTKHKQYDIAKAKIFNMDLVLFVQLRDGSWLTHHDGFPANDDRDKYFACLPKNKAACLSWLNGEQAEYFNQDFPKSNWVSLSEALDCEWTPEHVFMDERYTLRVKPKLELIDGDYYMFTCRNATEIGRYDEIYHVFRVRNIIYEVDKCSCIKHMVCDGKLAISKEEMLSFSKQWLHDNKHDGEDRSKARGDRHYLTAPDLYALVEELIIDAYVELAGVSDED